MRRALALLLLAATTPALALNKQGEARRGPAAGGDEFVPFMDVTGYFFAGPFLYNPTYASRPNNSGRALLRFGGHLDWDLYRRWLTLSYDANLFLDRDTVGVTEWDHIVGLLTFLELGRGFGVQLGVHFESDTPLDDGGHGYTQSYVDAMARLSWSGGRVSAFFALGGFLYNPSYAARPDNTGRALLRYQPHVDVKLTSWLVLRTEANFFSDAHEPGARKLVPAEIDAVLELAALAGDFELRLIGEADLPLTDPVDEDRASAQPSPGIAQYYVAFLAQWNFDARKLLPRMIAR